MTIHADWCWWTYFVVNGIVVTRGQIVDYDIASKSITYMRSNTNDPKLNPYTIGTPEFQTWNWDTHHGTFDAIWIDPNKSMVLSIEDGNKLENGEKPDSFLELSDQDPQEYFADQQITVSSYLPPALQARINDASRDDSAG